MSTTVFEVKVCGLFLGYADEYFIDEETWNINYEGFHAVPNE
jgi:hypothetical protein